MARLLNSTAADMLCLQEIQSNAYLALLHETLAMFPYLVYQGNTSKPTGGLLIASRRPVIRWEFHPYPNRGRKWSLGYADWALQKGVLAVHFEVDGLPVAVLNTHLQANYLAVWTPEDSLARIQRDQVRFLAGLVRDQAAEALVVVCGDFNFPPHAFLYPELIEQSGLIDLLAQDPRPSYQPFPFVSAAWLTRLDYALYRPPPGLALTATVDIVRLQDETRRFPWDRFLTDHFLLELALRW